MTRPKPDSGPAAAGARGLPDFAAATAAATFDGTYMRPNLDNQGTIPAQGTLSRSPDIWVAGRTPIADYQSALATSGSYSTASSRNLYIGYDNYIYVRGRNGASTSQTNTVQLFYAANAVIPWPSQWQSQGIPTDQGTGTYAANIRNLAPGKVGVADATFQWADVPPVPHGSSHYCLIAWFNDAQNSNPFPAIDTQLDMASLVANNLGWGWCNTVDVSSNLPTWSYDSQLSIPINFYGPAQYFVYVTPVGFIGWDVAFQTSQTDAYGQPIELKRTRIQQDNQMLGITCTLEPGFNATVSISMYSNGNHSNAGATVPLGCSYLTTADEVHIALARGLVDRDFNDRVRACLGSTVTPTAWVRMGEMPYTISNDVDDAMRGA